MKKVSIVSLVLMSVLVLGMLVSCQPEPEIQEVKVVNQPEKETFPAPKTVSVQNPDPNNSSNTRFSFTMVPYAESYIIYLTNKEDNFIYKTIQVTSVLTASDYSTSKLVYYSCASTDAGYNGTSYNKSFYKAGVRAISVDGVKSSITWGE